MPKVVIADADRGTRELIRATLASDRLELFEASTARQALTLALSTRPDVLILDRSLPGASWAETFRELLTRAPVAKTRLVVLIERTGPGERDHPDRMTGADAYISKPFSPLELLDTVAGLLGPEALA